MATIELVTTRSERMSIKADDVLALLRGAGFDIPDNAVLETAMGTSVSELCIRKEVDPTTQRVRVDDRR